MLREKLKAGLWRHLVLMGFLLAIFGSASAGEWKLIGGKEGSWNSTSWKFLTTIDSNHASVTLSGLEAGNYFFRVYMDGTEYGPSTGGNITINIKDGEAVFGEMKTGNNGAVKFTATSGKSYEITAWKEYSGKPQVSIKQMAGGSSSNVYTVTVNAEGASSAWNETTGVNVTGAGTVDVTQTLTNGKQFGIRVKEGSTQKNYYGVNNTEINASSTITNPGTGGNWKWTGTTGEVTIHATLDVNGNLTKVTFTQAGTPVSSCKDLYLSGTMNSYAKQPADSWKFTRNGNVYTYTVAQDYNAETTSWKIKTKEENWDYNFGVAEADQHLTLNKDVQSWFDGSDICLPLLKEDVITFTLVEGSDVKDSSNASKIKVTRSVPEAKDCWVDAKGKFQGYSDWGWTNNKQKVAGGNGTAVVTFNIDKDTEFGLKVWDNESDCGNDTKGTWYGASGQSVKNGDTVTDLNSTTNFKWGGDSGKVEATVTLTDGKITKVVFGSATPEVTTYYLCGSHDGWHTTNHAFTPSGSALTLTINNFELPGEFKVTSNPSSDQDEYWWGATKLTMTGIADVGGNDHNMKVYTTKTGKKTVLFTLFLGTDGKPARIKAEFPEEVAAGMPFYPQGCSTEKEFAALMKDTTTPYYYLAGHALNNGHLSPEWQMNKTADGLYTIDFTYTQHSGSIDDDHKCSNTTDNTKVWVSMYANAAAENATEQKRVDLKPLSDTDGTYLACGLRLRAYYDPASKSLTFKGLKKNSSGEYVETDNLADAQKLPYVSLVGNFKIPVAEGEGISCGDDGVGYVIASDNHNTASAWQNSWVQYDAQGNLVKDRKGQVMYNTQWPPVNEIMFESTDADGNTFNFSSDGLVLAPEAGMQRMKGSELAKLPEFQESSLNVKLNGDYKDKTFSVMSVHDFWAAGLFKLWSGWSGNRWDTDAAEWHRNWNWGYGNHSDKPTLLADDDDVSPVCMYEPIPLGNDKGDMTFGEPTFCPTIYFFLDVDSPNGNGANFSGTGTKGYSFLYLMPTIMKITAKSNADKKAGMFSPEFPNFTFPLSKAQIKIYKTSDDSTPVKAFDPWTGTLTYDQFQGGARPFTSFGEAVDSYYNDGFTYEDTGYYYYTLTAMDGNGREYTVKSNPYYIIGNESKFTAAQLVKVENGALPYDYVTYRPGSSKALGVTMNGDEVSEVTTVTAPSRAFLSDSQNATFTNLVLLYAQASDASGSGYSWTVVANEKNSDGTKSEVSTWNFSVKDLAKVVEMGRVDPIYYTCTEKYKDEEDEQQTISLPEVMAYHSVPTPVFTGEVEVDINVCEDHNTAIPTSVNATHFAPYSFPTTNEDGDAIEYESAIVKTMAVRLKVDSPNATEALLKNATNAKVALYETKQAIGDYSEANGRYSTTLDLKDYQITDFVFDKTSPIDWLVTVDGEFVPRTMIYRMETTYGNEYISVTPFVREGATSIEFTPDVSLVAGTVTNPVLERTFYTNPDGGGICMDVTLKSLTYSKESAQQTFHGTCLDAGDCEDDDNNCPYYALGIIKQTDSGLQHQMIGDVVQPSGIQWTGSNHLHKHESVVKEEGKQVLFRHWFSSWYAEMYSDGEALSNSALSHGISLSRVYFFETDETRGVYMNYRPLGFSPVYAPAKAPAQAPVRQAGPPATTDKATTIAFAPTYSKYELKASDIITSVEGITADGHMIYAGKGFIELTDAQADIFTTDGKHIYSGTGRVEVPAGIYLVATPAHTTKVVVK